MIDFQPIAISAKHWNFRQISRLRTSCLFNIYFLKSAI